MNGDRVDQDRVDHAGGNDADPAGAGTDLRSAGLPGTDQPATDQPPELGHVLQSPDLRHGLARIVAAAVDMMRTAHGALVLVRDPEVAVFTVVHRDDTVPAAPDLLDVARSGLGSFDQLLVADQSTRLESMPAGLGPELPAALSAATTLLSVPIRIRGRVTGALVLLDRVDGQPFDTENLRMLTPLAAAVTAAIENDLLYAEMQRRQRWLQASNEITTTVLSGAPEDEVLVLIADRVLRCSPADGAALLMMEPDGRMVVEHATGEAAELFEGMVADESWGSSLNAISTGRPVVIPDLGATRRSDHPAFRRLGPCMLLPMRAADRTLGAIAIVNYRGGRRFEPMDVDLAEAFANQTALATVLAEARSERERLIVFEERDRIARDLHDLVIQRLFATGMMLQGAGRGAPLPPDAEQRVTRAVDELDATVREIRQTIFALNQPQSGDVVGTLRGRILNEVASAVPVLGFQPHLRIEGAVDTLVPDEVANQLVAATREALSNVARHAQARAVDVHMGLRGRYVVLEVIDDGVGIGDATRSSGLGNLRVRATRARGWCATWPSKPDGTGTRLTFTARIS